MEAALKMQSLEWGQGRNSWMVTYQFKTGGFVRIGSSPANLFVKALYTFISAQANNLKRDVFWVWIKKPESKNSILHETTCCFPKVSVWKCQLEWTVRCQQGRHHSWCQCWQPLLTAFRCTFPQQQGMLCATMEISSGCKSPSRIQICSFVVSGSGKNDFVLTFSGGQHRWNQRAEIEMSF